MVHEFTRNVVKHDKENLLLSFCDSTEFFALPKMFLRKADDS